jgi:hypothetical protein
MNFKKIAITGAAAAIMLGAAVPAFAYTGVRNNAFVTNNVTTKAGVNGNYVSASFGNAGVFAGSVQSVSNVNNTVNKTTINDTCSMCDIFGSKTKVNNNAFVANNVNTSAGVNRNFVNAGMFGNAAVTAGEIGAGSYVTNVVNYNAITE